MPAGPPSDFEFLQRPVLLPPKLFDVVHQTLDSRSILTVFPPVIVTDTSHLVIQPHLKLLAPGQIIRKMTLTVQLMLTFASIDLVTLALNMPIPSLFSSLTHLSVFPKFSPCSRAQPATSSCSGIFSYSFSKHMTKPR